MAELGAKVKRKAGTVSGSFEAAWELRLETFSIAKDRCGPDHIKRMCAQYGYSFEDINDNYYMTKRKNWG